MKIRAICFLTLAWLAGLFVVAPAHSAEQYTFAVLPQRPAVAMHVSWRPFLDRLQQELGITFKLKLYETMPQFEEEMKRGEADFVFSTPPHVVLAYQKQQYQPLVRGSREIAGVLFTRKNSEVKDLQDLNNREIAFVGSRNVCSLIVKQVLSQQKVKLNLKQLLAGSSSNVYKSVLLGKSAAGAVLDVDFDSQPSDIKEQLQILIVTPKLAPHPISAHPRVPKRLHKAVREAVIRLDATPDGQKLLQGVQLTTPVRADYTRDYKHLESMDYEALTKGM